MIKKQQLLDLCLIFSVIVVSYGCAPSGVIVNREHFSTPVKKMHLRDNPYFKICHGGVIHQIPLKQIQLIKIDPGTSIFYDNELYYSAELIFKNGAKIISSKENKKTTPIYISVENTIIGESKEQSFFITLDNVKQIQIKK